MVQPNQMTLEKGKALHKEISACSITGSGSYMTVGVIPNT